MAALTIAITAPELLAAIQKLTNAIAQVSNLQAPATPTEKPSEPVSVPTATVVTPETTVAEKPVFVETNEPVPFEEDEVGAGVPTYSTEVLLKSVTAFLQKDKNNRDLLMALLHSIGGDSVASLTEQQRKEFGAGFVELGGSIIEA